MDARAAAIAGLLGATTLLTGCTAPTSTPSSPSTVTITSRPSGTASQAAPDPTPTSGTAPPSASPAGQGPTPVARRDPNAPRGQCADDALAVTIRMDVEGNGLSHRGFLVVFENTGTARCALRGIPGISFVGHGNGTRLGAPAQRLGTSDDPTVELGPQGFAVAKLDAEQMDAHGGVFADGHGGDPRCRVARADGYRVYPPHSYRAVFVRGSGLYACTTDVHWLTVGEVEPGDRVAGFDPAEQPGA